MKRSPPLHSLSSSRLAVRGFAVWRLAVRRLAGGRFFRGGFKFIDEGPRFGFGNVTANGFDHVLLAVALRLGAVDAEVARADSIGVQLAREPAVVDGFAAEQVFPGP